MASKIDEVKSEDRKQYLLSEIVFKKKQDQSIDKHINKIRESIKEIGFNNTANIFSIADSSKFGGKIGWVDESNLSKTIIQKLKIMIKINILMLFKLVCYLILKIDEIKINKMAIDKKALKNLIQFETNKQLNQYSKIYFNKVSVNYSINEK